MLNDDDFSSGLSNSTGQNSQQQKGLSGTTSGNDELKRRHRLAIEGNEKVGIQTHHDGRVTNIPPGMLNDQFGMAGLLTFLRTKESAPSIVGLALGHDLTNLGLNLNSSKRNLYQTFGGPWADFPCRIQDLDTKVPEEYLTNATIRDKLPNIKLNKLHEDVLFYLFYNCPGEVYQVAAASELYARDWRFHKSERFWLQRAPFSAPPREIGGTYERCQYNVFDPIQWRRVPREMVLEYKDLEGKPTVSGTNQQSSSSAGAMPPIPKADGDFFNLTVTVLNQLKNISQGMTIQKSEIRQLIYFLNENPEILGKLDNGNQFFNFLQYEPEIAGFYLAYQLMYDSTAYFSNLEILLNMNVNVQTLIAVNKFVRICEFKSLPIPGEFLNKFISLCISTCDRDSTHDLAAHRLVRMVCVFLDTLLGFKHFDPMTMRAEIQNFVTSYLNLREASQLYQKTLQI